MNDTEKSAIQKVRDWLATYPGYDILGHFGVDYTDQVPNNGGIYPSGLVEISRSEDLLGNVTVRNQYNFGLYYVLSKSPGDDVGAQINADWLMGFQQWVQEQSIRKRAPTFGNIEQDEETLKAQNGVLYDADAEGIAVYMVTLSVEFTQYFKVI